MHAGVTDKVIYRLNILVISAGMLLLAWVVSPISSFNPNKVAANPVPVTQVVTKKKPTISGMPVRITVPALAIDLPVEPGIYDPATSSWTIANKKAFFATLTALSNDRAGNTLIYGHNNRSVFRALHSISAPAQAYVYTDNGYIFVYEFQTAAVVNPSDTSIFGYKGRPILTLQTCDGTWNEVRKLFTFTLKDTEKV